MPQPSGLPTDRLDRLDAMLADRSLEAIWLARPNDFAWLTGGDNVVDRTVDVGVAAAGYDGDGVTVVTDNIEATRLREEELPSEVTVESYDWYAGSLAGAVENRSETPAGADFAVEGFDRVDAATLRQPLTDDDVGRYRALGATVAEAVEAACRNATSTDTERALAGEIRGSLAESGVDTPVVLVGGDDRAPRYRHYTPKSENLGGYALVSVTAQRHGLFASCTRTIAFDPPDGLESRHRKAARVEATALAATRAAGNDGGTAGDVFEAIEDAYDAVGWVGEWQRHHQGGAAGFAGREWIATPDSAAPVRLPMAYAWNPTIEGAKSEDTVHVTEDGFEVLTEGEWPTITVPAVGYDQTMDRPAVLER